ncbi:hypothetical protein ABBQ32_008014 [Trebouxia sp. C0010 RCD-2024]
MPIAEWRRSRPQACCRQGSACISAPLFLHSFGNTDSGHTAQIRYTGHHPCRPHNLYHRAHQKRAAHVRQRELAAHTSASFDSAPKDAGTAVASSYKWQVSPQSPSRSTAWHQSKDNRMWLSKEVIRQGLQATS